MDLSTITVADFKAQFRRDFPYLPVYSDTQIYNTGNDVFYPPTNLFYQCILDTVKGIAPVVRYDQGNKYDTAGLQYDSNKKYWIKKMDDVDNYIDDCDITNAFAEALILFNLALFGKDASQKLGYLYLSAHFLCNDTKARLNGITAPGQFLMTGRSAGSVSESYTVPQIFSDTPNLSFYTTSSYGMKYLNMILPSMTGNMASVLGRTHA